MHLATLLARNNGFVTRAELRRYGVSAHAVRGLIARGALVALTRNILARPPVPAEPSRAAMMGGRVACVTAAHSMGIWVLDDTAFHVVPRGRNGHFRTDAAEPRAVVHWTPEPIEPDGHRPVVESGRNALAHIARCQPLDAAAASFDSAVRLGLTTLEELQVLASAHRGRFADAAALVTGRADSGLETLTRVRLKWAGVGCREQVVIDGHPVDLLIGDRLVIQLDGKQHLEDPAQLARDRWQDRRLRLMGYTVLRYGYAEVVYAWDETLAQILSCIAGGAQLRRR
ncbi:endonuclease domain-containing protein [Gryllotalpicola reticulitermitis]|uniref:Endonuclease domain-containing protein n=1 Tax=Gryllotalpicola reticulitermitis TaxID=1184153 RepID=A0ABV8Q757_9MICO